MKHDLNRTRTFCLLLALFCLLLTGCGKKAETAAAAPAQVSYEEKLQSLRGALQESDALYVEQVYAQYRNYGKQLGYWREYLADSALQNMEPDKYVKRDLQFIVESDNSDVISSFSVSLLGTADYERLASALDENVSASNAVELVTVSNVAEADSAAGAPAVHLAGAHRERVAEFLPEHHGHHLHSGG